MVETQTLEDARFMPALAIALVDNPRATLQQLAKATGIGRTTLYRYCRTREELIERLVAHAGSSLLDALSAARVQEGPPGSALSRLIAQSLRHRELTCFLINFAREGNESELGMRQWQAWEGALDDFFGLGQAAGAFRADVTREALTEVFSALLIGLVEAERRGRVAGVSLAPYMETTFLNGAANVSSRS